MADLKIKPEFASTKIAFKGSRNKALGELEPDQLEDLALIAHDNRSIRNMFEGDIPTREELKAKRVDKKAPAKAIPAVPSTNSVKQNPESK
jgi:hypothetical protein